MNEWIVLKTKPPKNTQLVLAFDSNEHKPIYQYWILDGYQCKIQVGYRIITHWMPLPSPPEKNTTKTKNRWNDIKDKLPNDTRLVIAFNLAEQNPINQYWLSYGWEIADNNVWRVATHWMSLPKPPKEEYNERVY